MEGFSSVNSEMGKVGENPGREAQLLSDKHAHGWYKSSTWNLIDLGA